MALFAVLPAEKPTGSPTRSAKLSTRIWWIQWSYLGGLGDETPVAFWSAAETIRP